MIEIKHILFPTDFSDYAANAVLYVIDFAKKFGAKVTVIHVLSPPTYAVTPEFNVDLTKIQKEVEVASQGRINELMGRLSEEGLDADSLIEIGSPFAEIVKCARDRDVNLIVLATHGHGAVKHMLLGSTAEKVVRKAPCPVLTVRHPEHEFVHP